MYQLGESGQPWTDFTPSSPKYSDQKTFIFDFFLKFQRNFLGAIALSYPPRVRVRATAKLSAAFFHDKSSITIGGGRHKSAIVPLFVGQKINLEYT